MWLALLPSAVAACTTKRCGRRGGGRWRQRWPRCPKPRPRPVRVHDETTYPEGSRAAGSPTDNLSEPTEISQSVSGNRLWQFRPPGACAWKSSRPTLLGKLCRWVRLESTLQCDLFNFVE